MMPSNKKAGNNDARNQILANIRKSKLRGGIESNLSEVETRLETHPSGIIPKRSQIHKKKLKDLFQNMAETVQASVLRLANEAEIPQAVSEYLVQKNLPARVKLSGSDKLKNLPWEKSAGNITLLAGVSEGDDLVSLTVAFAGIAETGTLMLHSGADGPTTLNFLPETHMVVLYEKDIFGSYEAAWNKLRLQQMEKEEDFLPRTVNLITGPSRTGDIEQTIYLGAHGPHALHILLVEDE